MEQATASPGRVEHLDHLGLPADDTERAEKFYTEVFGSKVIVKGPCLEGRGARVFIKLGQNHIGLFSESGVSIPKVETVGTYPRYAFVVRSADFDGITARIKTHSFLVKPIRVDKAASACGLRHGIIFADSEGNLIELFSGDHDRRIRLHHVHLDTLDLDASIRFYNEILNLKIISREFDTVALQVAEDQRVVMHQVKELSKITKTPYLERHLGFTVTSEDFRAIVEKLAKFQIETRANLTLIVPRKENELTTYFKDPTNGFELQIINQDSEAFTRSRSQP
jgi:catechol 2,3-dioxygenase-like lactoylglutathione lyase family enzyme